MEKSEIKVSISCLTYNHAKFIRRCLDGFLSQQCNFQFEILIYDDASTDGTADIIREYQTNYPNLIIPVLSETNQYSKGVRGMTIRYNFPRARGRYIAQCEGDDYWTDCQKLQKQVDCLEKNKNFILCTHRYVNKTPDKEWEPEAIQSLFTDHLLGVRFDNDMNLNHVWMTQTLTLMLRNRKEIFEKLFKFKHLKDVHLSYYLLKEGEGYGLNFFGGVYSHHAGGVYTSQKRIQQLLEEYFTVNELFMYEDDIILKKNMFGKSLEIALLLRTNISLDFIDLFKLLQVSWYEFKKCHFKNCLRIIYLMIKRNFKI